MHIAVSVSGTDLAAGRTLVVEPAPAVLEIRAAAVLTMALKAEPADLCIGEEMRVTFTVTNTGQATAADFLALLELVHDIVLKRFNIDLESEVKIVGA